MPRPENAPDIEAIRPPKDSVWRCPCGWEGFFYDYAGHRVGWKKRLECHGKGVMVKGGTSDPKRAILAKFLASQSPPPGESAPNPTPVDSVTDFVPKTSQTGDPTEPAPHEPEVAYVWHGEETLGPGQVVDAEEIARRLNEQRAKGEPPNGNGHGEGIDLGDGEWSIEHPEGPPKVSQFREPIQLPAQFKVMYDHYRQEGWEQGDGSPSAWVTDCLLDYFTRCVGKVILVANLGDFDGAISEGHSREIVGRPA